MNAIQGVAFHAGQEWVIATLAHWFAWEDRIATSQTIAY